MDEYTKQLIEDARATYRDIVSGRDSRITRGSVLWDQFEGTAEACRVDTKGAERALAERINELAVARILAEDKGLKGSITYEPALLPSGRKIDEERRKLHPRQADFIAHKDWMGGRVYGNTFASRSRFLEYTLDFETRLTEAKKITPGPGLLVFCGNGVRWHRSNLEDFADFYHAGKHRQDDPFALMEDDHIKKEKLQIVRNVDNFGCLVRPIEQAAKACFVWPVRGPSFGGVVKS
jgi:hypothetical protein